MEIKNAQLIALERICNNYLNEKNGKVAWLFARNKTKISRPLEDLRNVLKPTEAIEEFRRATEVLAKEYADKDKDGTPKQNINPKTGQTTYAISRVGALSIATEKLLEEKYPQAKIDQKEIEEKTRDLLEETVNVDFYRMELKKLPGFRDDKDEGNGIIGMGDLAVLFGLDIVYEEDNVVPLKKQSESQG